MPDRSPSRAPTAAELRLINRQFSRRQLAAGDIAILDRVHLANNYQLAHGMYFIDTASSLALMADQINLGFDGAKSVHLMVNHQARDMLGLGTFFDASMADNDGGQVLAGKIYVVRDLQSGGFDANSLISAYDAGLWEDISIGQDWRGARFRCDVCGCDVLSHDCDHLWNLIFGDPLRDGTFATMTVERSLLHETSAVFRGALSDAGVGKLSALGLGPAPVVPSRQQLAQALFAAREANCYGMECSAHGKLQSSGLNEVLFSHDSKTSDREGDWSATIRGQRKFLPDSAFADTEHRNFPHHWVLGGYVTDQGRYAEDRGDLVLHAEGTLAALARATGDADGSVREHLASHIAAEYSGNATVRAGFDGVSIVSEQGNEIIGAMVIDPRSTSCAHLSPEDMELLGEALRAALAKDGRLQDHNAPDGANGAEILSDTQRAQAQETPMKTLEELQAEVDSLRIANDNSNKTIGNLQSELEVANKKLVDAQAALTETTERLEAAGEKAASDLAEIRSLLNEAGLPNPTLKDLKRLARDAQAALTAKDEARIAVLSLIDDLTGETGLSAEDAEHYKELAGFMSADSLSNAAAAEKLNKLASNIKAECQMLGIQPGRRAAVDPDAGDGQASGELSEDRKSRRDRFRTSQ